jgi:hypothetical protein
MHFKFDVSSNSDEEISKGDTNAYTLKNYINN